MFNIWQEKREGRSTREYKSGNIKILNEDSHSKRCFIFCSSNALWFPNTEEEYRSAIVEKDRYEWTNLSRLFADKVIYIRDIYKSWYVMGINEEIDNIEKLVAYMREKTAGYRVVCVGSSSGGYLAILLGCKLNADHVIAFSP